MVKDAISLVTAPSASARSAPSARSETTPGTTTSTERATTASTTERATAASTESSATTGCTTASRRSASTASTSRLLDLGGTWWGLGLGQELLEREELVAANVDLVASLKAGGVDAVAGLDGEVDLVQRAEDLVDLADLGLVLEEYRGVEVGDLGVDGLADHLTLGGVHEGTHLCLSERVSGIVWQKAFYADQSAIIEVAYP